MEHLVSMEVEEEEVEQEMIEEILQVEKEEVVVKENHMFLQQVVQED